MELPILLLEGTLLQQKEQLNDYLRRNKDKKAQAYKFRLKAIDNLKCFIAELEDAIIALNNINKPDEALNLAEVGVTFKDKKIPTFEEWYDDLYKKMYLNESAFKKYFEMSEEELLLRYKKKFKIKP